MKETDSDPDQTVGTDPNPVHTVEEDNMDVTGLENTDEAAQEESNSH